MAGNITDAAEKLMMDWVNGLHQGLDHFGPTLSGELVHTDHYA